MKKYVVLWVARDIRNLENTRILSRQLAIRVGVELESEPDVVVILRKSLAGAAAGCRLQLEPRAFQGNFLFKNRPLPHTRTRTTTSTLGYES